MLLWTLWQDSWPAHSLGEWAAFSCRVCWHRSQLCQPWEEQPGSTQPLCKEGTHGVFPGCSLSLGKLRCWLFPPCLCVPIRLWVSAVNLGIRRGSSCKTCIQSVSKLRPVSDTHPEGSMGSWAWWHLQEENLLPVQPHLTLQRERGTP